MSIIALADQSEHVRACVLMKRQSKVLHTFERQSLRSSELGAGGKHGFACIGAYFHLISEILPRGPTY